jgi:hypothetical protein
VKHRDCGTVFWTSKKRSKKTPTDYYTVKVLERGAFGVFRGNETIWLSDNEGK